MANFFTDMLDPGDLSGTRARERTATANAALDTAQQKADAASAANKNLYSSYLNKVNSTYGDTAAKYNDYLSQLENQEVYNPGEFSFDKTENDYFDKYYNQRVKAANNAITGSAANAGNMFSSDYLAQLNAKNQAMATEAWDNALNKYNQARQTALSEWQANTNAQQQAYQNTYNKNKDLLSNASNAQDNTVNAYGTYVSNLAGQNNTDAQNAANIASSKAANENANNKSLLGRIFG